MVGPCGLLFDYLDPLAGWLFQPLLSLDFLLVWTFPTLLSPGLLAGWLFQPLLSLDFLLVWTFPTLLSPGLLAGITDNNVLTCNSRFLICFLVLIMSLFMVGPYGLLFEYLVLLGLCHEEGIKMWLPICCVNIYK